MFSIQEQECRMHFDSNTKKDDQPAATLQFTYRRPHNGEGDIADAADSRLDDPGYLPCLKYPNMQNKVMLSDKVVGATVTVHHGIGDKSDLVMEECTVRKFQLDPQEGGTVVVSMEVDCVPTKEQAGELHMKQNQDVVVSIAPPEADDGQLEF